MEEHDRNIFNSVNNLQMSWFLWQKEGTSFSRFLSSEFWELFLNLRPTSLIAQAMQRKPSQNLQWTVTALNTVLTRFHIQLLVSRSQEVWLRETIHSYIDRLLATKHLIAQLAVHLLQPCSLDRQWSSRKQWSQVNLPRPVSECTLARAPWHKVTGHSWTDLHLSALKHHSYQHRAQHHPSHKDLHF